MQNNGHTPEWSGPMVERVMRNGKRLYTSAFKAWLVEQANKPGVSVAALALRHGVNANQLRHWMKLGHWQSGAPVLLPVTIVSEAATTQAPPESVSRATGTLEIEISGAILRVQGQVDSAQLRLVLGMLRA
ncbi:IS66-like element accessory protein TnpA [Roseateles sp.]|uniref:IS66-like element accessory protein TnpA n=1 Tax=Roseateles sp. TaxID=1971397 RepID=UPI0039ED6073